MTCSHHIQVHCDSAPTANVRHYVLFCIDCQRQLQNTTVTSLLVAAFVTD
jgi:hypothetical protein